MGFIVINNNKSILQFNKQEIKKEVSQHMVIVTLNKK